MKFKVENMTCGHCVKAITQALLVHDAAAQIQIDLSEKTLQIESSLEQENIQSILIEEDYVVTAIDK